MATFYATAIKMKSGSYYSDDLLEIDKIYLEHSKDGWYSKAAVHDYVKQHPEDVKVKNNQGPVVIACVSSNGEKYVKSSPNETKKDNLLSLPRK